MKVQPVLVISPLTWFLITFWKPIVVAMVVLAVLITLMFPLVRSMAVESAGRSVVPTVYVPEGWRAALTEAALTPVATPRQFP